MSFSTEGKLIKVLPEQSGEGRNGRWVRQDFVIEIPGEYPKTMCFSLWGEEKIKNIRAINEGDNLKVSFDISSREYNERWYTDLRAWKIEKMGGSNVGSELPPITENDIPPESNEENDLPF